MDPARRVDSLPVEAGFRWAQKTRRLANSHGSPRLSSYNDNTLALGLAMTWTRSTRNSPHRGTNLRSLRDRFADFLVLLEKNNQVLKIIGGMEETSRGQHLFNMNYIRASIREIRAGVLEIIDRLIALGGSQYEPLRERFISVDAQLEELIQRRKLIPEDAFTIPLGLLEGERAHSVGGKSALLGELKSRLNLPVPEGFAVTAWAYKKFLDANNLQAPISERIHSIEARRCEDLIPISGEIQAMMSSAPVPEDVAEAIGRSFEQLMERTPCRAVSVRSSAIGEDTLFSFAGQYRSFLNVTGAQLIDRYRAVLASKFTPQAIYYFLSHGLSESELAMGVCCMSMVDAAASGVLYTRDPVHADDHCMLVSSIYGLGNGLVDGTFAPDFFRISRTDAGVLEARVARKPLRLVARPGGGTVEEPVPEAEQGSPSLDACQLQTLRDVALKVEEHFGGPQDIEWALDRDGRLFVLQARPLRVVRTSPSAAAPPDVSGLEVMRSGGTTICPGAGCGRIAHATSPLDLPAVPEGAVLAAPNPFPALATVMARLKALVIETGGVAGHMATLAREYRVPTVGGVRRISDLEDGEWVTVDATQVVLYRGAHPEICAARQAEFERSDASPIFRLLDRVLEKISPLALLHPTDPNFTIENCRTLHDITRFAHQRALDEMCSRACKMEGKRKIGLRLKTDIPLEVNIIYIDQDCARTGGGTWVSEAEVASAPMRAFWGGITQEGWASNLPSLPDGSMGSVPIKDRARDRKTFLECSFAILGREYMILSLHLGYHFTSVEAMATTEPGANYIRMRHKEGGASLQRRIRRVQLIQDLLSPMGFEHNGKGDFLDSSVAYLDGEAILGALHLLGRITMLTKQLDIALSNDAITRWYTEDFMKRLGLRPER